MARIARILGNSCFVVGCIIGREAGMDMADSFNKRPVVLSNEPMADFRNQCNMNGQVSRWSVIRNCVLPDLCFDGG